MAVEITPVPQEAIPKGFRASGVRCGLKVSAAARDLALFVADTPVVGVATFTTNRVVAAPVILDRQRVPSSQIRAVVVNSGNANACTGEEGLRDAESMAERTAGLVGCEPDKVLVCSTGVIGVRLPIDRVTQGITAAYEQLTSEADGWTAASHAILTTDTRTKIAHEVLRSGGGTSRILGLAKGAGMIAPRMATMLAFLFTDARIPDVSWLDETLRRAVDRTFNCLSVDGHTSTNDTVILLASGAAACSPAPTEFEETLERVCSHLARQIAADGEGARHLVTIVVQGARSFDEARRIARAIADSPLVKTAIYGADPNWGRIVSAAGYAEADVIPDELSLWIQGVPVFARGRPLPFDQTGLSQTLRSERDVQIRVRVGSGSGTCTFWTCDLTEEYVRFNASYTT